MATGISLSHRVFVQKESTFGTIPNSSGASTVANADYMKATRCVVNAAQGEIPDRDKNPSGDLTEGTPGPKSGNWSIVFEARPRGTSAGRPDWAEILESALEADGAVNGSNYDFSIGAVPTIKSFSLFQYRGTTLASQLAFGCVTNNLKLVMEQGANARFEASGPALWVRDSVTWATDSGIGLGGYTAGAQAAFPTEPGSPVANGIPVNAMTGSATLDGNTTVQIKSAAVNIAPGYEIPQDRLFAGQFGSNAERDVRRVTIDLAIVDEDIAAVTNLYSKARSRTKIAITLECGSTTNNRLQVYAASCLLPEPQYTDDARKWAANLSGIICYISSAADFRVRAY